jgi:uncharacterized protein
MRQKKDRHVTRIVLVLGLLIVVIFISVLVIKRGNHENIARASNHSNSQFSELHRAVRAGNIPEIREFLKSDADLESRDVLGRTPLFETFIDGHTVAAKLLLESGANPNAQDTDGLSPLHFAGEHQRPDIAKLLLEHGADPNIQDKHGNTPLFRVVFRAGADTSFVKLLLDYGAKANVKNRYGVSLLSLAKQLPCYETLIRHGQASDLK